MKLREILNQLKQASSVNLEKFRDLSEYVQEIEQTTDEWDKEILEIGKKLEKTAELLTTKKLQENLDLSIEEVHMTYRLENLLKKMSIQKVGQLVQYKEEDMLKTKYFSITSLGQVEDILWELGLGLNMYLPKHLRKKYKIES